MTITQSRPTEVGRREGGQSPIPSIFDIRRGALDSLMFVRLRWRMLRGARQRALVVIGSLFVGMALLAASNVGTAIRELATSQTTSAAQVYAAIAMSQLREGRLSTLAATALGTAFLASLLSPFTGSSNVSLFPAADIAALRPNRMHRFSDSLITHLLSPVGFLSLFALTALASLLTADGGRTIGMLATLSLWPMLIATGSAESWFLEWGRRRFGFAFVFAITVAVGSAAGVVALFYRSNAENIFGFGGYFARHVAGASVHGYSSVATLVYVSWAVTALMVALGAVLCHQTMRLPDGRTGGGDGQPAKLKMGVDGGPTLTMVRLILAQTIRYPQVRRPLMAVLILGIPAIWVTGAHGTVGTTLVLGIPMAATIGWAVNFFGILGSGMTWLAALPVSRRTFLVAAVIVQVALIFTLTSLCWMPAWIAGRVTDSTLLSGVMGTLAATLVCGRSAMAKSIYRPLRATLASTSDAVVPPMRALSYTLRITAWGGQIGVVVFVLRPLDRQLLALAAVIVVVTVRYWMLLRRMDNRPAFASLVATVAAC